MGLVSVPPLVVPYVTVYGPTGRSHTFQGVILDTGTTGSGGLLPSDIAEDLGIVPIGYMMAGTATGTSRLGWGIADLAVGDCPTPQPFRVLLIPPTSEGTVFVLGLDAAVGCGLLVPLGGSLGAYT